MSDKSSKEADKLFAEGESYTRTTLTRWKPDWHQAASCFDQAAKKYRMLGPAYQEKLGLALMRAGNAYEELASLNTAATNYGQAVVILQKLPGRKKEALEVQRRTAAIYNANGQTDKAATTLVKLAKLVGEEDAKEAISLFKEAISTYLENDRAALSNDSFKTAIAFCVSKLLFEEAIELLKMQNDVYLKLEKYGLLNRNLLCVVVLLLQLKKVEAASDFVLTAPGPFAGSDEQQAASALIVAFKETDQDKLDKAKNMMAVKVIDVQIARIARVLAIDWDEEDQKALLGDLADDAPKATSADKEEDEPEPEGGGLI